MRQAFVRSLVLSVVALGVLAPAGRAQYYFGKNKIQYSRFQWQVMETAHFRLYFYTEEKELAQTVAAMAEHHYQDLEQKFAHHIFKPIPLILYSAPGHFQQTNTTPFLLPEGVGGFFEFMKGRVVIPCNGSLPDLDRVLRHELVHVFMHHTIDAVLKQHEKLVSFSPPLWFSEGLAECWSDGWDSEAEMIVRDAILTGYHVPLQEMHKIAGSYLMYKEGQSILRHISSTYGDEALARLLHNWSKAKDFNGLVRLTLGVDLKGLSEAWTYNLKKYYFPHMKDRESIDMMALRLTEGEGMNVKPAVIPDASLSGDRQRIAFLTNVMGYSDISILSRENGESRRQQIVKGGRSAEFESFHLLDTKLGVSGDGRLAFASKHAERDALCIWDLARHREIGRYRFDNLVSLSSPAWSPAGDAVAFSGLDEGGQSDLYMYDLKGGMLRRLTNDVYDDRDPDWSPDGTRLAFSSDRGSAGRDGFYNLFLLGLKEDTKPDKIPVAVHGPMPAPSEESRTPSPVPLTWGRHNDYSPAWSPDGRLIAFSSDRDSAFNLHLIDLQSGHWKLTNTFGGAFDPDWTSDGKFIVFSGFEGYQFDLYRLAVPESLAQPCLMAPEQSDSAGWEPPQMSVEVAREPLAYRKTFTLDIAQSSVAFAPGWGSFGGAQMALSDMLGNDQYYFFLGNTAESSDELLERFNVGATYLNQTHRLNYGYGAFHLADDYYNDFDGWYFQREFGLLGTVTYPLSKFERIESSLQFKKSDRRYSFFGDRRKALLVSHYLSYVRDTSLWGPVGPFDGMRCNITLGLTTNLSQRENHNISLLGDYRTYLRLSRRTCYAVRLVGYYSGGDEPLHFYLGGSWSLRGYSLRHFLGRKLLLLNNEFRFPLIDDLRAGLPFLSMRLNGVHGAFFFDMGNAWEQKYDGLYGSFGLGARMQLAGVIVMRLDVARTTDFHTISPGTRVHVLFGWNY